MEIVPISDAPIVAQDLESLRAGAQEILRELDPYTAVSEEDFDRAIVGLGLYMLLEGKPDPSWTSAILKNQKILQKFPILRDSMLVCQVEKCPYYNFCPVMRQLKSEASQEKMRGTQCRADRLYSLELLVGFIKELNVQPESLNEIIIVANMTKIMLKKRQVEWEINTKGYQTPVPHLVAQKTGKVFFKTEAHPLLQYSLLLDKQLEGHRKELLATRKEKAMLGQGTRAQNVMDNLMETLRKNRDQKALQEGAIDAQFAVKEKEEAED